MKQNKQTKNTRFSVSSVIIKPTGTTWSQYSRLMVITHKRHRREHKVWQREMRFIKNSRTDSTGIVELRTEWCSSVRSQWKGRNTEEPVQEGFHRWNSHPRSLTAWYPLLTQICQPLYSQYKMLRRCFPNSSHIKQPGPDGITPRVLKQLSTTVAPILCNIFHKSYDTGEITEDWRQANVVPHLQEMWQDGSRHLPPNISNMYCLQAN